MSFSMRDYAPHGSLARRDRCNLGARALDSRCLSMLYELADDRKADSNFRAAWSIVASSSTPRRLPALRMTGRERRMPIAWRSIE